MPNVYTTVDHDTVTVALKGLNLSASGPSLGEALMALTTLVVEAEARAEAKALLINILADSGNDERVVLDS